MRVFFPQVVSEAAYRSWAVTRQAALAAMDNREQLVMDTAVELETNLSLLGKTVYNVNKSLVMSVHKSAAWLCPSSPCRGDGHWGPAAGERTRHHCGAAGGWDPHLGTDWWQTRDSCQHWVRLPAVGRGWPGDKHELQKQGETAVQGEIFCDLLSLQLKWRSLLTTFTFLSEGQPVPFPFERDKVSCVGLCLWDH